MTLSASRILDDRAFTNQLSKCMADTLDAFKAEFAGNCLGLEPMVRFLEDVKDFARIILVPSRLM